MRFTIISLLALLFFSFAPLASADDVFNTGPFQLPGMPAQTPSNGGNTGGQAPSNGGNTGGSSSLYNPLQGQGNLESFLTNILKFVVRIGAIIVVVMLVWVGFSFVAARGEPAALQKARSSLLWTIIGALVLLGATAISLGIQATVTSLGG